MKHVLLVGALIATLGLTLAAQAQTPATTMVSPAEQRFYLLQAFAAHAHEARRPLQHIGLELRQQGEQYIVSALLDGYPAHQAGLRRGDRLLTVDGRPFHPVLSFNADTDSGPGAPAQPDRQVTLAYEREGQTLTATLQTVHENLYDSRRSAALASIQEFNAGNKTIAYFRPWALSRNLNDLLSFIRVVRSVALTDGLILDLRDSYGFLSIQHLDAFLPGRSSLFQVAGRGNMHTQIDAHAQSLISRHYGKPVAILINDGTSGGAELLAYQLAKLDRIMTVGTRSAGELGEFRLVQSGASHDPAGSVMRYEAPTDTTIDNIPLADFQVHPELEIAYPLHLSTRSDPQFEAGFNVLMGRI